MRAQWHFFGCAEPQPKAAPLPQYEPKALQPQGKGITVAKSTPYNCKILGEVEGKHNASGTRGATRELLRESAINDLKNEAGDTAGQGKRLMLNITKEEAQCSATFIDEKNKKIRRSVNCTDGIPDGSISAQALSYRIHAQVFDYGEK